jgi:hypothetical protein
MKTANKVISDRIEILNRFLERKMDNPTQEWTDHKEMIQQVKNSFEALATTIDGCMELRNNNSDTEAHIDMIKEFTGQTVVPLIEGVKQQVESFSQMIYSLKQKLPSLTTTTALPEAEQVALKAELYNIDEAIKGYEVVKAQTVAYLEEYETALEEIKEFVIAQEVEEIVEEIGEEIDPEEKKRLDSLAADIKKMKDQDVTFVEDKTEDNDFSPLDEEGKPEENKNQLKEDTNGEFPI